jgi:nucleoid-associated protein YgaU
MSDTALAKACLRVVEGDVATTEIPFRFNPSEYTIAKSSTWNRPQMKGGKQTGKPEFAGANPQTVQMEILLDRSEGGVEGVAGQVATLLEWVKPTDASVAKKKPQPPILVFEWGANPALEDYRAYLKQVSAKFLLFDGEGNPIRATANISLEEVPIPPKKQNPTSGAIHGRRSVLLDAGDSLAAVAWREYDDPTLWRGIAAFNGIDDPLRVAPGTRVLVPTADEARRLARGGDDA